MKELNSMTNKRLSQILNDEAERIHHIAERLHEGGRELTSMEKKDIRGVLSGSWLDSMNDEAAHFFRTGNLEDFEHNRDQVLTLMIDLC